MAADTDTPTPTFPDDVVEPGPIRFEGEPPEVAQQYVCAIQGLQEALENHGLQAQNPRQSAAASSSDASYGPGSARHGWLYDRWDTLTSWLVDQIHLFDQKFDELPFDGSAAKPWLLCRWAKRRPDGEWRPLSASEAASDLPISERTVAKYRRQFDEFLDKRLKDREWSV